MSCTDCSAQCWALFTFRSVLICPKHRAHVKKKKKSSGRLTFNLPFFVYFIYALAVYLHPKELLERNRDKEKDGFLLSSPVPCRTCCRVLLHPSGTGTSLSLLQYISPPPASISSRLEHGQRLIGWAWSTTRTLTSHRKRIGRNGAC